MIKPKSLRLTFSLKQDSISLERVRQVGMRSPAPDSIHRISSECVGCRVEVLNRRGDVLYSRRCQPFAPPFREVYTGDPAEPFGLSRKRAEREIISIVVPAIPGSHQVVLREASVQKGGSKKIDKLNHKDACVVDLDSHGFSAQEAK